MYSIITNGGAQELLYHLCTHVLKANLYVACIVTSYAFILHDHEDHKFNEYYEREAYCERIMKKMWKKIMKPFFKEDESSFNAMTAYHLDRYR